MRLFRPLEHARDIPTRPRFTIGKIEEELEELRETDERGTRWHATVEAADLINATYSFLWKRYGIPPFVVIVISLVTGIYKPVARWIRGNSNGRRSGERNRGQGSGRSRPATARDAPNESL